MADPFMGQIMQVGFNFAPIGWALAQGSLMAISQNAALYTLLGITFGGDGQQTFGLPDTRGRVMLGVGTGPGLQPIAWGEKAGNATVTILPANMPAHTHPATFVGQQGTTTASGTLQAVQVPLAGSTQQTEAPVTGDRLGTAYDTSGNGSTITLYAPASVAGTPVNLGGLSVTGGPFTPQGSVTIGSAGGTVPTNVLNPYVAVYTIIATQGIFPTRP
ncbi:phage tail protein [Sphingomonas glacialis]|uniref:Phage tail protein n=1 Tax=Sphingomonas glacialis TaxID=658225 RepID=A0A502FZD5_9SPHN|nr:tail fiber protein [Sphingomonas glacialis]TPG54243.1 phage tail protein [Sphingomonas glacialis]